MWGDAFMYMDVGVGIVVLSRDHWIDIWPSILEY